MRTSILVGTIGLATAVAGCSSDGGRKACGPDEVRIAERCVYAGDTAGDATSGTDATGATDAATATDAADAATDATASDVATDATAADVATDAADTGGGLTLPFYIDQYYVMSGFMGSGEVAVDDCGAATPAGSGPGACWKITWTPATGTTADWTGFYFQYPENNWGDAPGLVLPQGATRVVFDAWGAEGGESANFGVGISAADGFQVEAGYGLLTTSPVEHSISIAGKTYTDVAGAFSWFLDNPKAKSSVTFFLDDVRWDAAPVAAGAGCTDTDATNYDAAATEDDGSCTYAVTFAVDMGCPDPDTAFATVWVTGPFCSWCGDGFPLTDGDADGVWTGTFPFKAGALEYKFMTNGFASQEDLIDDAAAGGTCAAVTDGATYANRKLTVPTAPTSVEAVYGRCGACP